MAEQAFISKQLAAQLAFSQQQYDSALQAYNEALELGKSFPVTSFQLYLLYQKRSQCFLNLQRFSDAVNDANLAIKCCSAYGAETELKHTSATTPRDESTILAAENFTCFKHMVHAYVNKGDIL